MMMLLIDWIGRRLLMGVISDKRGGTSSNGMDS